jgi:hypothetical protein
MPRAGIVGEGADAKETKDLLAAGPPVDSSIGTQANGTASASNGSGSSTQNPSQLQNPQPSVASTQSNVLLDQA